MPDLGARSGSGSVEAPGSGAGFEPGTAAGTAPGVSGATTTVGGPTTAGLDVAVTVRRGPRTFAARLAIAPGEIVVVVGPSGAGKSSIVRALLGLDRPHDGAIRCRDRAWFDAAAGVDVRPRDRRIGALVQELALLPHLTAARNVGFGLDLGPDDARPSDRRAQRTAAVGWLDRLAVAGRADARPAALSGGERQRVALARALARDATALVLDEPFSALDAVTHERAAALVRETVARRAVPALIVTHDRDDAARLGARVLTMVDGVLPGPRFAGGRDL